MSSVEEVVDTFPVSPEEENGPMYVEHRTPEQIAELRARQEVVAERYRPLSRKATAQLRRAERAFLAANDNTIGAEREADALNNLFVAQNVAQYYRHALLDVGYAYKASDLRIHEDDYNGE